MMLIKGSVVLKNYHLDMDLLHEEEKPDGR